MGGTVTFDKWLNDDGSENYKCRAWVNFNGTGVVAIRASGNVSSITDNGIGDYTVNFIDAMPDTNYAILGTAQSGSSQVTIGVKAVSAGGVATLFTTTQVQVKSYSDSGVAADSSIISVSIHR